MPKFTATRTISARGASLPTSVSGEPLLKLRSVRGTERLSEIYEYSLHLYTPADPSLSDELTSNLDLKAMIGKSLTVTIDLDGAGASSRSPAPQANTGAGKREISGLVFAAKYLGRNARQSHYQITIKPWIELARQRTDYRIFQRQSVVEIIDSVLKDQYMYSYVKRLSNDYAKLEYQVQYGESDFAFIQRLMQEHGIYWFFEHSNGFHRMVLVDQISAHKFADSEAYRTLLYKTSDGRIDEEHISEFDITQSLRPGVWTTDDYDFTKPKAVITASNELPQHTAHNQLERYEWPGDYVDPAQGDAFARVRMQQLRAEGETGHGKGNVRNIACGTVFELDRYPVGSANQKYLVLGATFDGREIVDATQTGDYAITTEFDVQPANTMYRPRRTISRPRTTGPQTAIVTGAPGSEIWTNEYGQVKLKFHWDRSPVKDQNSSCWVRVSYPWTGTNYGSINIPRVGTEVIVDFENGDPDRPIVTGRVYNAASMPPWTLPDNATQSGTLTRSSKNGAYGNANAIRFEDRTGAEELWIHAEKDQRIEVEHDESHWVGNDRKKKIDGNETVHVQKNRTETVAMNETIAVGMNRTEAVGMNETVVVGLNRMISTLVSQEVSVGMNGMYSVGVMRTDSVGVNYQLSVGQNLQASAGKVLNVSSGGTAAYTAKDKLTLQCGQAAISLESNGNIVISGKIVGIQGAQQVGINGGVVDIN
ncbi:type VI secretion system tip protein VgrG [Paraburkholderia edwinii]|uniref:Type VI secretion system tip protein VgrG n=1 Tax=Paraburkholderia edwinii TaxID=2861782 RepID=A0ABX8UK91_9BURK|nr:type VI secretion system tip protein TssI/VgrG [Paraburkholderia edwinii]QYD69448.1 type VI secretion system tip protein VgrG [Paraburkholderia edwinii]